MNKKIFSYLIAIGLLLVTGLMVTSCSKEEDEPIDQGPSITLKTGPGYTYTDFEVFNDSTKTFGVVANKSTTHDRKLTRFNIYYNQLTLVDSVINTNTFEGDFPIKFVGVGTGVLKFKITAEGGLSKEISLNVTVKEPPFQGVEVKKYTNIELGSFNDPIGSFFNTTDGLVYTVSQAKQNQAKVDFLFFKGVTNQNTIAAPDDPDANTIQTFQLNEWTTKNPTRFYLINMTAAEFDAIGQLHIFPQFNTQQASSKANMLQVGNVIFFKTAAGKLGYIRVKDIYTKGDKIKLDVIVEK